MWWWQWLIVALSIAIALFVLFINPKTRLTKLLSEQAKVFYKYKGSEGKQRKLSVLDLISFFAVPLMLSCGLVWGFSYCFTKESANVLLTVVSILFSVLFSILSIIVAKSKTTDEIEKSVVKETFVSICTSSVLLLASMIMLIIYVLIFGDGENTLWPMILSNLILLTLFHVLMLILMIIKRFVLIYIKGKKMNK